MSHSEAGKLGWIASKAYRDKKHIEFLENYNKNPKICPNCGKPIAFEQRRNKFCSKECSLQYRTVLANKRNEHRHTERINVRIGAERVCTGCGRKYHANRGSNGKYCSLKCQADHKYKEYIKRWKEGKESGLCGEYGLSKYIRRYLLEKVNYKCEKCGWGEKNPYTENYVLEVHHKDGNYKNNSEDNLEVLCLNCHGMTKHYKNCGGHKGRIGRNKYRK